MLALYQKSMDFLAICKNDSPALAVGLTCCELSYGQEGMASGKCPGLLSDALRLGSGSDHFAYRLVLSQPPRSRLHSLFRIVGCLFALAVIVGCGARSNKHGHPDDVGFLASHPPVEAGGSLSKGRESVPSTRSPAPTTIDELVGSLRNSSSGAPGTSVTSSPIAPGPSQNSLAGNVASRLAPDYLVNEISGGQLSVRRPASVPPPSLFEGGIALSRIRGQLKSHSSFPPFVSEKTTLRNGIVTIPFGPQADPRESAEAIASALATDGIHRVNASFSPPR